MVIAGFTSFETMVMFVVASCAILSLIGYHAESSEAPPKRDPLSGFDF